MLLCPHVHRCAEQVSGYHVHVQTTTQTTTTSRGRHREGGSRVRVGVGEGGREEQRGGKWEGQA